jgi:thiol:disulfide interchange protein DsbD
MKYFILITLFITSLFASNGFLQPSEAFKINATLHKNTLLVDIKLGEDIYLYKERFSLNIKDNKGVIQNIIYPKTENHNGDEVFTSSFIVNAEIYPNTIEEIPLTLEVEYQGCSEKGLCYEPMSKEFSFKVEPIQGVTTSVKPAPLNETDTITQTFKSGNIGLILLTFFGFGLLLSLTPCVFPMIPILSSIIVSQGEGMNAKKGFILSLVYVLAMSVAYTLAGVFAGLFGANIQAALQNPWVLSAFSALFVLLALSMFGFFEIGLPSSLQSKLSNTSSKAGDKGGFVGVAIMGFLSALIVGPCVAPPLAGALVYIGQTGDALLGGLALFVLSLGMGMPLLLIGIGAGKFMPRPGGWMTMVTATFGVMMLGVAIWMLGKVIDDSVVIGLYSMLGIGFALYLGVFEKEGHIFKRSVALLMFIYSVSLFLGFLAGSPSLKQPLGFLKSKVALGTTQEQNHELNFQVVTSIMQLDKLLEANKGKKIMLDFSAEWCTSCKELEEVTFSNEKVKKALSDYVLIRADVTENSDENKALSKKYGIFGPPALIFFDENLKVKSAKTIIGFIEPEPFLEHLKKL